MSTTGKARDNIRLRAAPSFDAPEIGFIYVTKDVEVVGVEGDWLRVLWEDKEGYVARKFILVADQQALADLAHYAEPPSPAAESADDAPKPAAKPKKPARPKTKLSAKPKPAADED